MIVENPAILISPWASGLLALLPKFDSAHRASRYGYATLIGVIAASMSSMNQVNDLGKRVDFAFFSEMYLIGVILSFVTLLVIAAGGYCLSYEASLKAVQAGRSSRLYSTGMFCSLLVGYITFWGVITVPQNL